MMNNTMVQAFLLSNDIAVASVAGWFRSDPQDELVGLDVRYHEAALFNKKKEKKIIMNSAETFGNGSLLVEMDPQDSSLSDHWGDPMIPRFVPAAPSKHQEHPMHSSI